MGILGKLFGLFRKKDETSFSIKFDYFDPATAANRKFISLDLHEGQVISREIIDFPRETGIKLKPKIWIIEDPRLGNGNRRIITHIEDVMKEKERDLCKVWGESIPFISGRDPKFLPITEMTTLEDILQQSILSNLLRSWII